MKCIVNNYFFVTGTKKLKIIPNRIMTPNINPNVVNHVENFNCPVTPSPVVFLS